MILLMHGVTMILLMHGVTMILLMHGVTMILLMHGVTMKEIETCWSVFKCFNMNVLDYYFIVYKSALVGV